MKHDPVIYREVCTALDALFRKHQEKAAAGINRYMRIRRETRIKQDRIAELESELGDLKKADTLSRKKRT